MRITNSGAIASGIIDAIDASDATIDNALNIGANNILSTGTVTFSRADAGAVTLAPADDAGAADIILDAFGAGAITIGSGDVTSVTLTTDNNLASDVAVTGGLTITSGATHDSFTVTSSADTENGAVITAAALTTGSAATITSTNTATGDTAAGISAMLLSPTFAQTGVAQTLGSGYAGLRMNFTSNPTIAGNTENMMILQNQVTANVTDNAITAGLLIDNADTSVGGSTVLTDALRITNSGAIAAGVTNGINFGSTTIDTAIRGTTTATNIITFTNFTVTSLGVISDVGAITSDAAITGTSFDIGANSLTTTEWAFLDAQDQNVKIASTPTFGGLDVNGSIDVNLAVAGTAHGVCTSGETSDNTTLSRCTGTAGADYAERYPIYQEEGATEPTITYGDIVVPGTKVVVTENEAQGQREIVQLVKSSTPYQGPVAGIVSNNYHEWTSAGNNIPESENPMPVALVGRVPVNVTNEGGAIAVGDFITTSSTAGKGMKATQKGRVIGMALGAFNGTDGQVMVQVINTWYDPTDGGESASNATDFFVENRMQLGVETITVNDDNNPNSPAVGSVTPTTSYVEVNCLDANGCNLNVEETSARAGDLLYIASLNLPVIVGDRENILNGTNPELGNDDTAMYIYTSGKEDNLWIQLATSDN